MVVNGRSSGTYRRGGSGHVWPGLDVHEDLLGGVLGLFGRPGHHHRNWLTDEPDLVAGQHRLVDRAVVVPMQEGAERADIRQIVDGEDRDVVRCLDGNYPSVRYGLRTNLRNEAVRARSATNLPSPVRRGGSSRRGNGCPIHVVTAQLPARVRGGSGPVPGLCGTPPSRGCPP